MLIAGPWFAPMMLPEAGAGHRVRGELYRVDAPHLKRLDAVESIGTPGNFRIEIEVAPVKGGSRVRAFAYAKSAELATPIHSEFLEDYQDRRFIPPWCRSEQRRETAWSCSGPSSGFPELNKVAVFAINRIAARRHDLRNDLDRARVLFGRGAAHVIGAGRRIGADH